jgi:hypothetical protein
MVQLQTASLALAVFFRSTKNKASLAGLAVASVRCV